MKTINIITMIILVLSMVMCSKKYQHSKEDIDTTIVNDQAKPITDSITHDNIANEVTKEDKIDTLLIFSRGACFGKCPVYNFAITKSGKIYFNGRMFVKTLGKQEGQLNTEELQMLFKNIDNTNYFELENRYPINPRYFIPDLPNTNTEIRLNGRIHKILNNNSAPVELIEFENYLEELILNHESLVLIAD